MEFWAPVVQGGEREERGEGPKNLKYRFGSWDDLDGPLAQTIEDETLHLGLCQASRTRISVDSFWESFSSQCMATRQRPRCHSMAPEAAAQDASLCLSFPSTRSENHHAFVLVFFFYYYQMFFNLKEIKKKRWRLGLAPCDFDSCR